MADKVDIFMQFFPADYLADTQDLTTEEHGAYLLLLMALWRHEGKVDNNPARLATTTRVEIARWPGVWSGISRFFVVKDGCISQGRLLSEIERARARKHAAISNGQKGGLAKARRARASLEPGHESATSEPVAGQVADSGSSSPSPSPSPQEEDPPPTRAGARDPGGTVPGQYRPAARPYPVGAATTHFLEAFDRYPNQNGKNKAASVWQDLAATHTGGEVGLKAEILAAYAGGILTRHPYAGEAQFRPSFESFLSERRWLDPASAPDNKPAARAGPAKDVRYGHARAEDFKHTRTGEVKI